MGTKWVQAALKAMDGAKLDVDGKYGPATRAAVEKFQRSQGLTVDAWAGVNTNDALRDMSHGVRCRGFWRPDHATNEEPRLEGAALRTPRRVMLTTFSHARA